MTILLFAASSGTAAVRAAVTPLALAAAINEADATLVPYRTSPMAPGDIRSVRCIAPEEEPTEFQCRWQQRIMGGWVKRTTWLTVDANGWRVMDG